MSKNTRQLEHTRRGVSHSLPFAVPYARGRAASGGGFIGLGGASYETALASFMATARIDRQELRIRV